MQVWDTIATEYAAIKAEEPNTKNYLDGTAIKDIVDVLLQNMCYVEGGEEDPDNEIRGEAYLTLYDIGSISGNIILQQVLDFVSKNISSLDYKCRSASLRAFCTLLEGTDIDKMEAAITSAIHEFLRLLDDNSKDVQYNAAFSLNKIAEEYPKCLIQHKNFGEIVDHLMVRLDRPPKVSIEICGVFTNLGDEIKSTHPSKVLQEKL